MMEVDGCAHTQFFVSAKALLSIDVINVEMEIKNVKKRKNVDKIKKRL